MPQYECKFNDEEKWEDVSESELLSDLKVYYGSVSNAIQQIIKGKHVRTSKGVYRLKMRK